MAILQTISFETGDIAEAFTGAAGTYSIQNTVVRFGSYALRTNPTTTATGNLFIVSKEQVTLLNANGAELMKFNINLSIQNNQAGMWLYVWTGNKRAVKFYTKHGFKIIGHFDFKLTDSHSNPNHLMYLEY